IQRARARIENQACSTRRADKNSRSSPRKLRLLCSSRLQADRDLGPTAGVAAGELPGRTRADVLVPDCLAGPDHARVVVVVAGLVAAGHEVGVEVWIGRLLATGLDPHLVGR